MMSINIKKINSLNFVNIFCEFENKLNTLFHKNTRLLEGGRMGATQKSCNNKLHFLLSPDRGDSM